MQGVGHQVGAVIEVTAKVDDFKVVPFGNCRDELLYLPVPVTCSTLETAVPMENWGHAAHIHLYLGVCPAQGFDDVYVISVEVVAVVGPVAWVGIVQSQVYYCNVGRELKRSLVLGQVDVWAVPLAQKGSTGVPEVAYLISLAKHLLQLAWV